MPNEVDEVRGNRERGAWSMERVRGAERGARSAAFAAQPERRAEQTAVRFALAQNQQRRMAVLGKTR